MQIVIDHQIIEESRVGIITGDEIKLCATETLPPELRNKVLNLINQLKQKGIKEIEVQETISDSLLQVGRCWVAIKGFLDQEIKRMFLETIGLLVWYFGPHWTKLSDLPKSTATFCADCTTMSRTVGQPRYCWVPGCSSHDKWKIVIGPSYTPPPPQGKKAT